MEIRVRVRVRVRFFQALNMEIGVFKAVSEIPRNIEPVLYPTVVECHHSMGMLL